MKPLVFLAALFLASATYAQTDDLPLDESLIVSLYKVADGGYLSKIDIPKVSKLEVNEKDATILSFEYVCEKSGSEANIHNKGPELSEQIIGHLNNLKIGSKVTFENIRIENRSGEVLAKPVKITIKS